MEKEKLRSEIENKYKWDLSSMYRDEVSWDKEYQELSKAISGIKEYEGHVLDSSKSLENTLNEYYDIEAKLEKLYVYASCKHSVDIGNIKNQQLLAKARKIYRDYSLLSSFIFPEILTCDYEKIKEWEHENNNLEKYHIILKRLFQSKKHSLKKEKEQLFTSFDDCVSNFDICSSYLRDKIMDFGYIVDENGKQVELTSTNYSQFMRNKNRDVRKNAYERMRATYEHFNEALAFNYIGHIKYTTLEARERKYNSVLDADLESLNISRKVFDSLLEATHKHLDIYQKEHNLIKKILKVEELKPYDLSAPLLEEQKDYPFEKARELILDMTNIYGAEYHEIASSIFENHWIDVLTNKDKSNGWYQSGSYLSNPVIFANYFSKYIDVSSLAHELGHAVNAVFSAQHNPYCVYDMSLFTAEVASLTNEMLLGKLLLQKLNNKEEKLEILNTMISVFSSNFFDGVKGAEFEYEAHKLVEENKAISPEILNNLWENLCHKYVQNSVTEINPYTWSRVPHFFSDFYYYKYATGVAAAMTLSDRILNGNEKERNDYIEFLKLGDSLDPIDALKVAGIDMTSEEVYEEAILSYNKLLDMYLEVYNS